MLEINSNTSISNTSKQLTHCKRASIILRPSPY